MWDKKDIIYFRKKLTNWFSVNKRDFPWRQSKTTNYEIIISEILLQRTKAETVAQYYNTFFSIYPNWEELTQASLTDLEQILKPIGLFKHRAKRIYQIIKEYRDNNGALPNNHDELKKSQLSSYYLSNAYKLFILNKKAALLDVNMSRVLSRFFYPKEFKDVRNDIIIHKLSNEVTNVRNCKELNWSIIDFGALICKSSKPKCQDCELSIRCKFYNQEVRLT